MNALTPGALAFDWKNPDYAAEYIRRGKSLERIRQHPERLPMLRQWYAENPADFINDWGFTFDPRNADLVNPVTKSAGDTHVPFLLFPKQREWVEWTMARWRARERGLVEKSRDMGISWLAVSTAATICLFNQGVTIGFGSATEDLVDQIGNPDSLFWKARFFIENLPEEFRGGWTRKANSAHMRITFPHSGSAMTGDAGDNIGRGGRSSIYFVDESAALPRPMLVEASLSGTTNCRIDMSTPKGRGNLFAQKRFEGKIPVFSFHWRNDPRKDDAWYEDQKVKLDPVTLAQEVDMDYNASAVGVLIPSEWVQAAVDAHVKLGIEVTGRRRGALDVADEGIDLNAFAEGHGILLDKVTAWSGKGSDTFATAQRAFDMSDAAGIDEWYFDADGLGAGIRGDARVINEGRRRKLTVAPFRGSASGQALHRPEAPIPTAEPDLGPKSRRDARKNVDYFANAKAQGWWELRVRFQRTFRAVTAGTLGDYDPDDLISLNGSMPELVKLTQELSQPTYSLNTAGKVVIDKQPEGTRSPNHADAAMILYAPRRGSVLDYLK